MFCVKMILCFTPNISLVVLPKRLTGMIQAIDGAKNLIMVPKLGNLTPKNKMRKMKQQQTTAFAHKISFYSCTKAIIR